MFKNLWPKKCCMHSCPTSQQHRKGTCFVYHTCGLLLYTINTLNLLCFHSHLCFIRRLGCRRRWRKNWCRECCSPRLWNQHLHLTCIRTSSSIIHRSPILTMKRFTNVTSASFIISPIGFVWCTILAGEHSFPTLEHRTNLTIENFTISTVDLFWHALLVDPKDSQPLNLTTLSRCAEQDCLRLRQSFSGGTSARALNVRQGTIIAACIQNFLVGPNVTKLSLTGSMETAPLFL